MNSSEEDFHHDFILNLELGTSFSWALSANCKSLLFPVSADSMREFDDSVDDEGEAAVIHMQQSSEGSWWVCHQVDLHGGNAENPSQNSSCGARSAALPA